MSLHGALAVRPSPAKGPQGPGRHRRKTRRPANSGGQPSVVEHPCIELTELPPELLRHRVMVFLAGPELQQTLRLTQRFFARLAPWPARYWQPRQPSPMQSLGRCKRRWRLAPGTTLAAARAGDWMISALPRPFNWAPAPMLLLRPSQSWLQPTVWPGGQDHHLLHPEGKVTEKKAVLLLLPTSCALRQLEEPRHCLGTWLHSRLVGPSGRWVELQFLSLEWPCRSSLQEPPPTLLAKLPATEHSQNSFGVVQQFFGLLRWQPGGRPEELLFRPLPDWDDWEERGGHAGGTLLTEGFGRVEWDGCEVSRKELRALAEWLEVPFTGLSGLWRALTLAVCCSQLVEFEPTLKATCGRTLVEAAQEALQEELQQRPESSSTEGVAPHAFNSSDSETVDEEGPDPKPLDTE